MSNSFFFLQAEKNDHNSNFIEALERHAESNNQQIYVIDRPLGDRKYTYDYIDRLIMLAPGHKTVLMDFGTNKDKFEEFVDDFTEDLASISDKFQYKSIIGRSRYWWDKLIAVEKYHTSQLNTSEFLSKFKTRDSRDKKSEELLISLLTGSINDIEQVKADVPDNILDKVKQKIVLFDGDRPDKVYLPETGKQKSYYTGVVRYRENGIVAPQAERYIYSK